MKTNKMDPEYKQAEQELYNTLKDRPSKEIKTNEELEAWLDEE